MKIKCLVELKSKDLKNFRTELLKSQKGKCLITKKKIKPNHVTLDHKHSLKDGIVGEDGAGLIRGVLDFRANSFEGRVLKLYKRSGLFRVLPLPLLLRNLADYLERDYLPVVHPKELTKYRLQKLKSKKSRKEKI